MNILAPSQVDAFCADRNTMLATAKSLPDALKVVATSSAEPSVEDGSMQLHIGLDGASYTVPFRHGMRMDQLKDKVLKITGIPVEEQMYVFTEDARLVDTDALVPLDEPLRCVRSTHPEPPPTEEASLQATDTVEESSEEDLSKDESSGDFKWPVRCALLIRDFKGTTARESWADLTLGAEAEAPLTQSDVAEDSMIWSLNASERSDLKAHRTLEASTTYEPAQGSSLSRDFTARWRAWDEAEHQHQFYIAMPENRREEFQVVQVIKKACPSIYKADIMVRLRGRGSGFQEGRRHQESTDPLMICVSGRNGYSLEDYWEAFYKIAALLEEDIYSRYNRSLAGKKRRVAEVHLEDDWVNGGVRLHGEADASSSQSAVEHNERRPSSWTLEFTDAWRAWDENERQHQFYIDIPEAYRNEFQVIKRIKYACRDIFSDRVMLRCRGRGSGFLEGRQKVESSDPLMICLSGRERYCPDEYWGAFFKLATFLEDDLYAEYNASKLKPKPAHLNHRALHGGVRRGGRVN